MNDQKGYTNMQVNTLICNTWVVNYADYLFSLAYYEVGKKEEAEDLVFSV